MGLFYHFSHFLEILTGIYFGGFALLGFIEKEAVESIYNKIQERQDEAKSGRVASSEFFKKLIKTPYEGPIKFVLGSISWFVYALIEFVSRFIFLLAHIQIKKIANSKSSNILQKKFFPSFFFAGCFCLVVILFSAIQEENCNTANCHKAIDFFIVYYLISSIIFQIWSLGVFPRLVNKIDYVHLTSLSLLICGVLLYYSLKLSRYENLYFNLNWFLSEEHKMWLITSVIFVSLIPLLFIIGSSIYIILSWELPIIFYKLTIGMFSKKEIQNDINKLKDN